MKKTALIIGLCFTLVLSLVLISCEKDEEKQTTNNSNSLKELNEIVNKKYGLNIKNGEKEGTFVFEYSDGTSYLIENKANNIYHIKNTTIYYRNNIDTDMEFLFDDIEKELEIFRPLDTSRLSISAAINPCDQHPANESFDQCFKREWNSWCQDFATCATQITSPHLIALAISIHCKAC